jgi:hypothetical protein
LLFANSAVNATGATTDNATFTVTLPGSLTWFLWGRLYYPGVPGSNDANSFFAKIDTGSLLKLGNNLGELGKWHWDGDGNTETGSPDPIALGALAAGAHTVTIYKREVAPIAPRLDVVCFSPSAATPTDAEVCASSPDACAVPATTTTTIPSTTTTTTLPDADLLCVAAGSDPSAVFSGAMTTGTQFTGGADADALLDNLSTPLVFANSTTNASSAGSTNVTYAFDVPSTTTWYLWGRFYYPGAPGSNDANSFFARVDAASAVKFGNNLGQYRKWHWDGNGNTETGAPDPVNLGVLGAGPHTITVHKREVVANPPRLDVLCLSKHAVPPTDEDACLAAGACSSVTTTTSTSTTTTSTTPPLDPNVVCVAAADAGAVFAGAMTTGPQFTGGADADPVSDNLTSPLAFANSSTNSKGTNGDTVTYGVTLPATQQWFLWGRFYYPGAPGSNDANSFTARLDAGTLVKFGNNLNQFRKWHWGGDGNFETGTIVAVPLGTVAAGNHTITILKREVLPTAPRLDVICVTDDGISPPTDAQACVSLGGCH